MSEQNDVTTQVILQRMADIAQSLAEVRTGQVVASEHSREMAVRLERLASNVEHISKVAIRQDDLERRFDAMDIKMALVDDDIKRGESCIKQRHEERLARMEHNWIKLAAIAAFLIGIVTLVSKII